MQKDFKIKGMHCTSCEQIIKDAVKKVKGVKSFRVDYATGKASITGTTPAVINKVYSKIKGLGYTIDNPKKKKDPWTITIKYDSIKSFAMMASLVVIMIGGYLVMQGFTAFTTPGQGNFLLLFITGLMVGFHCIGMCGGFVMSYSTKKDSWKIHTLYGSGKLISYSLIGGLFGLLGAIIVFTPMMRGIAGAIAGLFLVIYGLNMLGLSIFRRIRLPTPKFLNKFITQNKDRGPLVTGLLNGLMLACGPLQAMYIYAAGTGSFVQGALSLFFFGLGTLPIMLGFGVFTTYISKKTTHNIVRASGAIMMVLGLLMLNYGLTLTGTGFDVNTIMTSLSSPLTGAAVANPDQLPLFKEGYQEIRMEVNNYGWKPDKFVLKRGIPVKWIINGKQINGCNNAIQVPKLGLQFDVNPGEQVIEFTPTENGVIPWSCWMGMIPGVFIVEDDVESVDVNSVVVPSGGSCGGNCGSSTCEAATGGSCGCGG